LTTTKGRRMLWFERFLGPDVHAGMLADLRQIRSDQTGAGASWGKEIRDRYEIQALKAEPL
jgi:hypothetical protein